MNKIALLIVYNHRFDRNIPILNKIYEKRFSHIYHIMPFYDGKEKNVIPIYESSYQFSGYISQAYTHLKNNGFTHFFIVADDMVINPEINETNFWETTGIYNDSCYISSFISFQNRKEVWMRTIEALRYTPWVMGTEIRNIIPTYENAIERFELHDLPTTPIPYDIVVRNLRKSNGLSFYEKLRIIKRRGRLAYPLVGGYSDIFLITADAMDKFCLYCGAFAATRLFVEIAVPTALVLATEKIQHDKDIKLKGKALWSSEDYKFLNQYNNSLSLLTAEFPKDILYIHPIKLSKWK